MEPRPSGRVPQAKKDPGGYAGANCYVRQTGEADTPLLGHPGIEAGGSQATRVKVKQKHVESLTWGRQGVNTIKLGPSLCRLPTPAA
jgi:hypothetical protein